MKRTRVTPRKRREAALSFDEKVIKRFRKIGFVDSSNSLYPLQLGTNIGLLRASVANGCIYMAFANEVLGFEFTRRIVDGVEQASNPHSGKWNFVYVVDHTIEPDLPEHVFGYLEKLVRYPKPVHWLGNLAEAEIKEIKRQLRLIREHETVATKRRGVLAGNYARDTLPFFEFETKAVAIARFCELILRGSDPDSAIKTVTDEVATKTANSSWDRQANATELLAIVVQAATNIKAAATHG